MERPNVEFPRAQKSIFHPHRDCNPLQDLVGDDRKGWRVERNLLKCLNHLPLLLRKENIAERLGLHNTRTPQETFEKKLPNSTYIPKGEWIRHLKWIRISIDAATPKMYEAFRGKPFFKKVERNLLTYLENSVSTGVGGSFLYSKTNIHEYIHFVRHFYELVRREKPHRLPCFNLSFRPLRQNPNDVGREFPEMISESDIDITVQQICEFAAESPEIKCFLCEQTNIEAVLGGNFQPALPFQRCYYLQIFHIVRADGDVRPCFVTVLEPEFSMGNLITGSVPEISLRSLYIAAIRQRYCNPEGCRQCHTGANCRRDHCSRVVAPSLGRVFYIPKYLWSGNTVQGC